MTDHENGFADAAAAFAAAERELKELHAHAQEVVAAGASLRAAEAKTDETITRAADALAAAETRVLEGADKNLAVAEKLVELIADLVENTEATNELIRSVSELDPGRIRRDLDEIAKAQTDNAAELREARRELSDIRRDGSALSEAVRESAEAAVAQNGELRADIAAVRESLRRQSIRLAVIGVLLVVLTIVAIVVAV